MSATPDHCPECGCLLTKGRSRPDHNRLFGLIAKAFTQWPETHDFQPRDPEHLRAYLLVKVGHIDVAHIPAPPECENPAIKALFLLAVEAAGTALARKAGYFDIRISAAGVEILTPRSINHRTVSQREFGPIRDALQVLIEETVGVRAEQLLKERAA